MNAKAMDLSLRLKLDKVDSAQVAGIEPEERIIYLNDAADRFKKQRYGGNNPHRTGFEQTQKRIDDLRTIVKRQSGGVVPFAEEDDVYVFTLPTDYDYLTNIRIFVCEADCNNTFIDTTKYLGTKSVKGREEFAPKPGTSFFGNKDGLFTGSTSNPIKVEGIICRDVRGKEIQHDDLRELLLDPFNKPITDSPLFVFEGDQIFIYANPDFVVASVEITYLKKLIPMSLDDPVPTGFVGTSELPEHTHNEIVRIAVDEILENIKHPRHKAYQLELLKQE